MTRSRKDSAEEQGASKSRSGLLIPLVELLLAHFLRGKDTHPDGAEAFGLEMWPVETKLPRLLSPPRHCLLAQPVDDRDQTADALLGRLACGGVAQPAPHVEHHRVGHPGPQGELALHHVLEVQPHW